MSTETTKDQDGNNFHSTIYIWFKIGRVPYFTSATSLAPADSSVSRNAMESFTSVSTCASAEASDVQLAPLEAATEVSVIDQPTHIHTETEC